MDDKETSRRSHRLLAIALLCTLTLLWVSGNIGRMLTRWVVPPSLPFEISELIVLDRLSEGAPPVCPDFGAMLIISPERAESTLSQVFPAARWFPPGIIHDGVILHGFIRKAAIDFQLDNDVPLIIAVDKDIGHRPHLICRVPAPVLNRLFREELEDDLASEEDYLFGEYRIIYRPTFKTFNIRSVEDYVPEPVARRRFRFSAKGELRIKLNDKSVQITTDGRVRALKGILDVRVIYDHDGYRFWYDVDMQELRVDINNLQNMFDRSTSKKLEHSLEKSLDRRKSKVKLLKKKAPHWVPVDLALDFQLTPG